MHDSNGETLLGHNRIMEQNNETLSKPFRKVHPFCKLDDIVLSKLL